jgi:uncharacterized membrane protein YphA (DoxX/SURF4 family)
MGDYTITEIVQMLIGLFLGIGLLQSGTDKIVDWKGNMSFLTEHFAKNFMRSLVTPMLLVVTVLETVGGILCLGGVAMALLYQNFDLILMGMIVIAFNFVALFAGQRFSKDYAGAAVLVNYFILTIIGILTYSY